jgi:branched-chain amino acid transport system ATP-binding protein
MAILEVRGLTKHFAGLVAVTNLDFKVNEGEIVGLIGPNGAGKTTVLNLITGFHRPTEGEIIFRGEKISGLKPDEIADKGLVRTFQPNTLFQSLTVYENVVMAHHLQRRTGFFDSLFNTRSARMEEEKVSEQAVKILEFMKLAGLKNERGTSLSHGHQRALGLALVLASKPQMILLDEPVTGMNAEEIKFMVGQTQYIRDEGVTLLVVEHNMRVIMGICDRIVVLNFGKKIAEGTPKAVRSNEDVIKSYLGA